MQRGLLKFIPNYLNFIPEFAGVRYPDLFSVLHFLVRRQKRPCFLVPSNLMGELKRLFCIVDNIQLIK